MRHRNRYNLALLAVVVALGLAALLVPEPSESPPSLTSADPADVERAEIGYPRGDRQAVRLERGADGWRLTAPIGRRARDGRVVTALSVLDATSDACYRSAEHELADFGLESPRAVLRVGDVEVAFGDRSADGRRYVRAGDRLCLLDDLALPLLAGGAGSLGAPELLPPGSRPVAIRTPAAAAEQGPGGRWSPVAGGDARAWARRWRAARAARFVDPAPAGDLGTIRVRTADGRSHRWRIAAREPELVLVPAGTDYGVVIAADRAGALLAPPAAEGRREESRE